MSDNNPDKDDQRKAAEIRMNISSHLISGALGMLGIQGAYLAFILESREPLPLFYVAMSGAALSFVLSIVFAGKGMDDIKFEGFRGDWALRHGSQYFVRQAVTLMLGLLTFAFAIFAGGASKASTDQETTANLEHRIVELNESLESINETLNAQSANDDEQLRQEIEALRAEIEELRTQLDESDSEP